MATVTVENLSKCYKLGKRLSSLEGLGQLLSILDLGKEKKQLSRELWALKDVSFSVEPGEVLGVIGRNGAGKSTLLKILARITLPTAGRALIRGRVVPLLELGAGFHPDLTGRENIYLNAAFHGISKEEVTRNLDEIIAFAELEDFVDSLVRHYSSGMYIRLAFSNAIHMRPDILLADEVLAVGDIGFQNRCMNKMREISQSGITVLFVSHDMEAIKRMCDRCIRLDKGVIVDSGSPADVVERYQQASLIEPEAAEKRETVAKKGVLMGELGEFLDVRLVSDAGHELAAVRVSQEVSLHVRVRVHVPHAELFLSYDVRVRDVLAFRTVAPSILSCINPGIYEACVYIPKHLLAEAEYSVNAGARISAMGKETTLVWYEVLSFRVYDVGDELSARGEFTGRLPGVVCPRLNWQLGCTTCGGSKLSL